MYCIYLACSELNGNKLYKIGYTRRDVNKRLKEFKTGNASDIYLVSKFKSKWGTKIESKMHKFFLKKRISGEWFNLDENDIKLFLDKCIEFDDTLNFIEKNNTYYIEKNNNKLL